MAILALVGLAISLYLTFVKLTGTVPACGLVPGCETVDTSPYAAVAGIPVALGGAVGSVAAFGAVVFWRLKGQRNGLLVAYIIGLVSLPVLAYLTYLELFVIHAICIWCVSYAVTVIIGWLIASWAISAERGRKEVRE
jgi:uncharacterized membrane protein